MVKLHIKRGDESLFLYDTSTRIAMEELLHELVALSNAREQVLRLSEGKHKHNTIYQVMYTIQTLRVIRCTVQGRNNVYTARMDA